MVWVLASGNWDDAGEWDDAATWAGSALSIKRVHSVEADNRIKAIPTERRQHGVVAVSRIWAIPEDD